MRGASGRGQRCGNRRGEAMDGQVSAYKLLFHFIHSIICCVASPPDAYDLFPLSGRARSSPGFLSTLAMLRQHPASWRSEERRSGYDVGSECDGHLPALLLMDHLKINTRYAMSAPNSSGFFFWFHVPLVCFHVVHIVWNLHEQICGFCYIARVQKQFALKKIY